MSIIWFLAGLGVGVLLCVAFRRFRASSGYAQGEEPMIPRDHDPWLDSGNERRTMWRRSVDQATLEQASIPPPVPAEIAEHGEETWNDSAAFDSQPQFSRLSVFGETGSGAVEAQAEFAPLDALAREFLDQCDDRSVDFAAAQTWFADRGCDLVSLAGGSDWGIAQASQGDVAVVFPAIRRPMSSFPLNEFFNFVNYNGLQPITASMVVHMARRHRRPPDGWHDSQRGEIHG